MSAFWAEDFDLVRERREDLRRDDVAPPAAETSDDENAEGDRP